MNVGKGKPFTVLLTVVVVMTEEVVKTDNKVKRQVSSIGHKIRSY